VSVYVFDLFGTLVNYGSLIETARPFTHEPDRFMEIWRQKQIALAQAGTLMERFVDFDTITKAALEYAAAVCEVDLEPADVAALTGAWETLPPFGDVKSTLAELRARGDRLGILTNGTHAMLERVTKACGIAPLFNELMSVQDARKYKPAVSVYQIAVDRFGLPKEQIRFVSSNGWDAAGASEFGFEVFWCNRAGMPNEPLWKPPAHIIASLSDLV
jgi:2-haloacid dehalogenase